MHNAVSYLSLNHELGLRLSPPEVALPLVDDDSGSEGRRTTCPAGKPVDIPALAVGCPGAPGAPAAGVLLVSDGPLVPLTEGAAGLPPAGFDVAGAVFEAVLLVTFRARAGR